MNKTINKQMNECTIEKISSNTRKRRNISKTYRKIQIKPVTRLLHSNSIKPPEKYSVSGYTNSRF